MNCAAIILAAGFSTRMGRDKALLKLGTRTALERLVNSYQTAGVERILVVTGRNDQLLRQLPLDVEWVRNPAPDEGMFSSIKAGVSQLAGNIEAFFVHPVDIPLVSPATLQLLMESLALQPDQMAAIPCFRERRGHPPLLRNSLRTAIMTDAGDNGLRGLLAHYRLLQVACDDKAVMLDMDTPEQYAVLQELEQEPAA